MIVRQRGFILPVVLLVLLLLGLLVAMSSLRVNADVAATQAIAERLQTRIAAEAGIERVKLLLRDARLDVDAWYNNPDELHRVIVWMHDGDRTVWGTNDEFEGDVMAYRFSIVADDPDDDEERVRFGITDESAKLNLNTATEAQLLTLIRPVVADDIDSDAQAIVNAILDWRDGDSTPRGDAVDTEGAYYRRLATPYRVANAPFTTVEELLLVKGVTGQVLYGEDFDRNGLLTDNEDDDDDHFPPDNQDGVLNRGLYPYLTVLSKEDNVSNENRPRVYLFAAEDELREGLTDAFPDEPNVVEFIIAATQAQRGGGNTAGNNPPGGRGGARNNRSGAPEGRGRDNVNGGGNEANPDGQGDAQPGGAETGDDNDNDQDEPNDGGEAGDAEAGESGERPGGAGSGSRIDTPAALLRDVGEQGQPVRLNNPLTLDHLPILLDRTTTVPPQQRSIVGLINVNTAPRPVLRCIEGLTDEQIEQIVDLRGRLGSDTKATPAWLLTEEIVDLDTFIRIAPKLTARGQQFTIESLGYADHIGIVTRLQVVVEMVGPIAQTVYYRDLTYLGGPYPIREADLERVVVR